MSLSHLAIMMMMIPVVRAIFIEINSPFFVAVVINVLFPTLDVPDETLSVI
jgi:hypothetical protein